jgi:predicted Zn-dependent peptidase
MVNLLRSLHVVLFCSPFGCAADEEPVRIRFATEPVHCDGNACLSAGTTAFHVAGIRVIHKHVSGEPLIAANVLFDRGEGLFDPKIAHAQSLLMQAMRWWGSQRYADRWSEELNRLGASHWAISGSDYAHSGVSCPAPHFDRAWHLLSATLLEPPIDLTATGFNQLKASYRHSFETELDEAPDAAWIQGWSLIATDHPYNARRQHIDELDRVGLADVRSAWQALLQPGRMTVVIVGDIEHAEVERLIQRELSDFIRMDGAPAERITAVPPLHAGRIRTKVVAYPNSPAWHIRGFFPAPSARAEADYAALQLGSRVLSRRLFDKLRVENGLAYDVGVETRNYRANYGTFVLSTESPALAMLSVRGTIETLFTEGIRDDELDAARAGYITEFIQSSQSAYAAMLALGDWELTAGDRELVDAHIAEISNVTASSAQAALAASLPGMRIGAAGPGQALPENKLLAELNAQMGGEECLFACYCQVDDARSEERCNSMDDDCDGSIDEGVLNACGRCGEPPLETCNLVDDDCDGSIDEGVVNACGRCGQLPAESCNGNDDDCDGKVDEGVANACGGCGTLTIDQCSSHHTVFISSLTFAPTFGDLAVADMRCQQLAESANRSGTWRALLVDANHTLTQRVRITKPVFSTRNQLVANDSNDFFTGSARSPVTATENGGTPKDTVAWVGSSTQHCDGWTSTSAQLAAGQALSSQLDRWLFGTNSGPCNLMRSLYCIDQD